MSKEIKFQLVMEHRFRLSFEYNDTHLSIHEHHIGWATKESGEKIKIG